MRLGDFLKKYRIATGISGRRLAERIGVSKYSLERWENAGRNPSHSDAQKLISYFGFTDIEKVSKTELERCVQTANAKISDMILPSSGNTPGPKINGVKAIEDLLLAEREKRIADLERLVDQQSQTIVLLKRLMEKEEVG